MGVKAVRSKELGPPLGLYSHGMVAPAGDIVVVAGQVGMDAAGRLVGPGDVAAQTKQAYENIRQVLAAAGCTMRDVVRFQTFLTLDRDIEGFMRARREVFPGYYPDGVYPPNTILVVSRLVQPELLIEIEAMAVKPTRGAVGARRNGSPRIRVAASTKPVRAVKGRGKVRPAARRRRASTG